MHCPLERSRDDRGLCLCPASKRASACPWRGSNPAPRNTLIGTPAQAALSREARSSASSHRWHAAASPTLHHSYLGAILEITRSSGSSPMTSSTRPPSLPTAKSPQMKIASDRFPLSRMREAIGRPHPPPGRLAASDQQPGDYPGLPVVLPYGKTQPCSGLPAPLSWHANDNCPLQHPDERHLEMRLQPVLDRSCCGARHTS